MIIVEKAITLKTPPPSKTKWFWKASTCRALALKISQFGSLEKPTIVAEESISSPVCLWDVFGKRGLVSARLNVRVARHPPTGGRETLMLANLK
jgi:hypothetical protein